MIQKLLIIWGLQYHVLNPTSYNILFHCKVTGAIKAGNDADEVEIALIEMERLSEGSISFQMVSEFLLSQSLYLSDCTGK